VLLGIGFGWNREEAANHGMTAWAQRRDVVREKVAAMRALWTDDVASYDGEHVRVAPSWMRPKPVQRGGPPVLLGGAWGPRLFREIAQWGDGWMPITARGTLAGRVDGLWHACEEVARDPATVQLCAVGAAADVSSLTALRAEGVHRAVLTVWDEEPSAALRTLDAFAAVRDSLG
jgi:alkanesulfonate monooxygenase SsuD/methylene tetrahydromethanopterin reductase-like flavin-dependent oxidoreductase (luciferase family)